MGFNSVHLPTCFCPGLTLTSFKFKCLVLTADGLSESFIQFTVTAKEIS